MSVLLAAAPAAAANWEQSALLLNRPRRLALSVLTRWNPGHHYGTRTIRGVAARLLAEPLP